MRMVFAAFTGIKGIFTNCRSNNKCFGDDTCEALVGYNFKTFHVVYNSLHVVNNFQSHPNMLLRHWVRAITQLVKSRSATSLVNIQAISYYVHINYNIIVMKNDHWKCSGMTILLISNYAWLK